MATVGRVGRCATCAAFTYDAHELSEEELRRLVLETEGRVLTTLVRRLDGRVMSVDCGHGTVRARRPLSGTSKLALAFIALLALAFGARAFRSPPQPDFIEPAPHLVQVEPPPVVQPVVSELVMRKAPVVLPPKPPVSDVLRVDVHLSEVNHSWNKLIVQTNQVVDSLESQLDPVRGCYRTTLETSRGYRGVLSARLFVERDGHVSRVSTPASSTQLPNAELERCVEASLKDLEFPGWGSGQVSFKLVFAGVL